MEKLKKTLKTIIWSLFAFLLVVVTFKSFLDEVPILWIFPFCVLLFVIILCIKGRLPGTNIKKMTELHRKETAWYKWRFSLGEVLLLLIMLSMTRAFVSVATFNFISAAFFILWVTIIISYTILIWDNRKKSS